MNVTPDRLKYSQWILERNLQWIAASDVKTAVIVAVSTGMLGALASAFGTTPLANHSCWANASTAIASVCLGFAIICATMTVLPRIGGSQNSFIFAGAIANLPASRYATEFGNATDEELLADCLAQIHRNADIARQKFSWVRAGITSGLIAVFPWILALATLLHK
jgi:hypothetical protein